MTSFQIGPGKDRKDSEERGVCGGGTKLAAPGPVGGGPPVSQLKRSDSARKSAPPISFVIY